MNSSYSLEKQLWARQEDLRREAQNIELIPLRPNPSGQDGNATLKYWLLLVLCGAALATLLIARVLAA